MSTPEPAMTQPDTTSGRSVLRGGAWNVAGTFVPQLSLLAISVAAARFLGPSEFGRQSFIAFVEVSAMTLFTAGIPLALARFVGELLGQQRGGVARQLVRGTWLIEAVGAVLGGALLVTIGLLGAQPRAAWFLAGVVVFATVLQRVPTALLTGLQRWRRQSLVAAALPAVATLLGAGAMDRIRTGFSRALRLLVVVTVPLTALSIALGPLALRLVYGEEFRRSGPAVIVLLAPFPLIALCN